MNTCMKKPIPPNFFIRRPCYGIWQAAGIAFQTETTTLPSPSWFTACLSFRDVAMLCRSFTCVGPTTSHLLPSRTAKRQSWQLGKRSTPYTCLDHRSANSYTGWSLIRRSDNLDTEFFLSKCR